MAPVIRTKCMFPFVRVRVHIRITSSQAGRYEVFSFVRMSIHHPFGSLLGAIQMDDAYVSWLEL